MQAEFILIGKITRPQGNRGELRVTPLTDYPQRFDSLSRVFVIKEGSPAQETEVEQVRYMGQAVILKLSCSQTISEAQGLAGAGIAVPESKVILLPADVYFQHQLIQLKVYTDQGEYLGKLEEIIPAPGNDVYVVRKGGQEILLPAVKQVIQQVDLVEKRMTVHLLPGLKNPDAL
jgi:16S rRNA processing protein RimM